MLLPSALVPSLRTDQGVSLFVLCLVSWLGVCRGFAGKLETDVGDTEATPRANTKAGPHVYFVVLSSTFYIHSWISEYVRISIHFLFPEGFFAMTLQTIRRSGVVLVGFWAQRLLQILTHDFFDINCFMGPNTVAFLCSSSHGELRHMKKGITTNNFTLNSAFLGSVSWYGLVVWIEHSGDIQSGESMTKPP